MEPSAGTALNSPRAAVALVSLLRSSKGQADPYPIYAKLRSLGPVVPSPWGLLLTTHEACSHVLRGREWLTLDATWRGTMGERWDTPANHELSRTLILLNAPEHTQQRQLLGHVFDRSTLTRLQPVVDQLVATFLGDLEQRLKDGEADFAEAVGEELPIAAVGHWLGIPASDFPLLRRLTHDQAHIQELFPSKPEIKKADEAALELRSYFTALVQERRRRPSGDVISGWLKTWDAIEPDPAESDEKVRCLAEFFVEAGLETTSTLLNTALWLLTTHPDQADWLRRNPHAIPQAVEEILRYDPPVQVCSRVASQDTSIDGRPIARGELVYALLGSAHHDPQYVPDPDRFNVHRGGRRHLAFGAGAHYCLGAGLARLETVTLLQALLRRFPRLTLTARPTWEARVAFRRITSLRIGAD